MPFAHPDGPWFRRRPRLTVPAASALVVAVTVLRFAVGDESDAITLLYALPVALVALAFGLRAGLLAAITCTALLLTWVLYADVELSALGWISRVVPVALLGALIGQASDAQRRSEEVARRLALSELRQREAAELNDILVQHLAVAKWALERGAVEEGIEELTSVMEAGQAMVRDLLSDLDGRHQAQVPDRG